METQETREKLIRQEREGEGGGESITESSKWKREADGEMQNL